MAHDEEMLEIGSIIFEDGDIYKSRQLKKPWFLLKKCEKDNMARLKLKRYLALLANKELRKKMFNV